MRNTSIAKIKTITENNNMNINFHDITNSENAESNYNS